MLNIFRKFHLQDSIKFDWLFFDSMVCWIGAFRDSNLSAIICLNLLLLLLVPSDKDEDVDGDIVVDLAEETNGEVEEEELEDGSMGSYRIRKDSLHRTSDSLISSCWTAVVSI